MISSRWPRPIGIIESIAFRAGLERLLHRLAVDHARRLELERPRLVGLDRAAAVERTPERVDDAAEQRVADGDAGDAAGAAGGLAFLDVLPLAEERGRRRCPPRG